MTDTHANRVTNLGHCQKLMTELVQANSVAFRTGTAMAALIGDCSITDAVTLAAMQEMLAGAATGEGHADHVRDRLVTALTALDLEPIITSDGLD